MKKLSVLLVTSLLSFNTLASIVVIGNPSGVGSLSPSDVKKIFLGKSTKLSDGSTVRIVELMDGSAGRIAFHEVATGRSEAQIQSAWSRLVFTGKAEAPIQVEDYNAVIAEVASYTNAVGYVEESALNDSVKVLHKF
ncbi:phosphate ABC transporter substrate-binding protein [Vibrio diazotrophicus]|uniref:phosphate ABC transporter substrate-binding protein n=1 Tax=Vibrio diazotrophicus TaxID=685 RepID=UPI000C9E4749|nr:phosphate ABC transporter substrate-binding protein [Vibrio diazotrophicus]PNH91811.1 phosphate ABC transporter substrate-binding protein [Vibrio diazotrophicus]